MINLNKEIAELSSLELSGKWDSTKEEKTQAARFLGKLGGKKSVESRFNGKTKEEVSEIMRRVRLGHEDKDDKERLIKHLQDVGQIK